MKLNPRPALSLATAGVVAIAVAGPAAFGGGDELARSSATTRTMTLTEVGQSQAHVDNTPRNSPNAIGRGDAIVFTKPLADSSRKRVATLHGVCFATAGGRKEFATCYGSIAFKDGTLAFSEIFEPALEGAHQVAITGGTGAYTGATGAIVAGVNGTNDYAVTLTLP